MEEGFEGSSPRQGAAHPEEMLKTNKALQSDLQLVLERAESVRKRNQEMQNLCRTLMQTRQQQARHKRTAVPVKSPMKVRSSGRHLSSAFQIGCSFWTHNGKSPEISEESAELREILTYVPPSFRHSFTWTARETRSLCYAVLGVAQERLSERVFAEAAVYKDVEMETVREGIQQCRHLRLDSDLALEAISAFDDSDWQNVANRFKESRSAFECQIQWTAFVRPNRNQRPFTPQEATQLQSIAQKHRFTDWKRIAEELATGRHPAECLRFYRQHYDIPNRAWTDEEDKRILRTYQEGGKHALQLLNVEMGRDFRVVMARLRHLQEQRQFKKGIWSLEEDLFLLKAVLRHGRCWMTVSADVPGRSGPQCRERFVYTLFPSFSRDRRSEWSVEETDLLKKLAEEQLERHGKISWTKVAKKFNGVSPRDVLNKWNSLMEQSSKHQIQN